MRSLNNRLPIDSLSFPPTIAHAKNLELALWEADNDIEIYEGGVDIRILAA